MGTNSAIPLPACPQSWVLIRFASDALSPADRDRVERHLVRCDACREKVSQDLLLRQEQSPAASPRRMRRWIAAAAAAGIASLAAGAIWVAREAGSSPKEIVAPLSRPPRPGSAEVSTRKPASHPAPAAEPKPALPERPQSAPVPGEKPASSAAQTADAHPASASAPIPAAPAAQSPAEPLIAKAAEPVHEAVPAEAIPDKTLSHPAEAKAAEPPAPARIRLSSSAFSPNGTIPSRCSAFDGKRSPPLSWSSVPEGTRSLVLLCENLDGVCPVDGKPICWTVVNMPPSLRKLPECAAQELQKRFPGGEQGSQLVAFGGLFGAPNRTQRFRFTLYALDDRLDLPGKARGGCRAVLEAAMRGHVLGMGELVGACALTLPSMPSCPSHGLHDLPKPSPHPGEKR